MNLLIRNTRELLPTEKRELIEHKEKIHRRKGKIISVVCASCVITAGIILFPGIIKRTAGYIAPIYGVYKVDPVITEGFKIEKITGKSDIAQALQQNNIIDANIASQQQLAEVSLQPQVNEQSVTSADGRVLLLYRFLKARGSPMAGSAAVFISTADKYGINWKLLPSIAGTESDFGRIIPIQASGALSFNPFGFGVYGGTFVSFKSWDDAIQTVGKSLAVSYGVQNLKPGIMEQTYCPPCYNGDHHWVRSVNEFMSEL